LFFIIYELQSIKKNEFVRGMLCAKLEKNIGMSIIEYHNLIGVEKNETTEKIR